VYGTINATQGPAQFRLSSRLTRRGTAYVSVYTTRATVLLHIIRVSSDTHDPARDPTSSVDQLHPRPSTASPDGAIYVPNPQYQW